MSVPYAVYARDCFRHTPLSAPFTHIQQNTTDREIEEWHINHKNTYQRKMRTEKLSKTKTPNMYY